jgi:hypothetical protein
MQNNYKPKGVFFPRVFGKEPIKGAEELPDKLEYDARLVRKRQTKKKKKKKKKNKLALVSNSGQY